MAGCRWCSRPWSLPDGVDASQAYCPRCSPLRQAAAREAFAADGKETKLVGRYLLRARSALPGGVEEGKVPETLQAETGDE